MTEILHRLSRFGPYYRPIIKNVNYFFFSDWIHIQGYQYTFFTLSKNVLHLILVQVITEIWHRLSRFAQYMSVKKMNITQPIRACNTQLIHIQGFQYTFFTLSKYVLHLILVQVMTEIWHRLSRFGLHSVFYN